MTDLTAAVERHCELFNECVRTGDWVIARITKHATETAPA